jgi:hypothetical protein
MSNEVTKEITVEAPQPRYLKPLVIKDAIPGSLKAMADLRRLAGVMSKFADLDGDKMTTHHFSDGIYARQYNQIAGSLVISKIHAMENFLILLSGECVISTGDKTETLVAPHIVKTMPGMKRAVLAITDITMITFHPNPDNERDMSKLEARYIISEPSPGYEEEKPL